MALIFATCQLSYPCKILMRICSLHRVSQFATQLLRNGLLYGALLPCADYLLRTRRFSAFMRLSVGAILDSSVSLNVELNAPRDLVSFGETNKSCFKDSDVSAARSYTLHRRSDANCGLDSCRPKKVCYERLYSQRSLSPPCKALTKYSFCSSESVESSPSFV